jgi:hypothetical protein
VNGKAKFLIPTAERNQPLSLEDFREGLGRLKLNKVS